MTAKNPHSIKGWLGGAAAATGINSSGALDFTELTAKVVDVGADSVAILDATDSTTGKEAIADIVDGIVGANATSAISATAGVARVNIGSTTANADPAVGDKVLIETGGVNKSATITNLAKATGERFAGTNATSALSETDGVGRVNIGSTTAKAAPVAADKVLIEDTVAPDAGVNKRCTLAQAAIPLADTMAGVQASTGLVDDGSGVLTVQPTDAAIDVVNDLILFKDVTNNTPHIEAIPDFVEAIRGTPATTGITSTDGVLTAAIKLLHLVADEKSSLFVETGEFDFSGSADAVDTKKIDVMAAKGELLFALISVSQVADGTASAVISISSTAAIANKMAGDLSITLADTVYQNKVGNLMMMWPVAGADRIVSSGGDVYLYAASSAGRTAGKVKYVLVFRKSS